MNRSNISTESSSREPVHNRNTRLLQSMKEHYQEKFRQNRKLYLMDRSQDSYNKWKTQLDARARENDYSLHQGFSAKHLSRHTPTSETRDWRNRQTKLYAIKRPNGIRIKHKKSNLTNLIRCR